VTTKETKKERFISKRLKERNDMSISNSINKYTKTAVIFFIIGKLLFIPTVISIFDRDQESYTLLITLYIYAITSSILFSLYGSYKMNNMNKSKELKSSDNGTFLIKVKNGNIIEVLQNI
jgi:hypothetical protein